MNINNSLKKFGTVDVSCIKDKVALLTDVDWQKSDWRQKKYGVHRYTQTILLIFDEIFREGQPTILETFYEYDDFVRPMIEKVGAFFNNTLKAKRLGPKHGNGYVARLSLVNLLPGGVISPHLDHAFTLRHSHRVHIPITTNEGVIFIVGQKKVHMEEGELWEISNGQIHSVSNDGVENRVHLIIDWRIPGERCCCGTRLRPQGLCSREECYATDNADSPCNCYS